jgi:hypothetical protein
MPGKSFQERQYAGALEAAEQNVQKKGLERAPGFKTLA